MAIKVAVCNSCKPSTERALRAGNVSFTSFFGDQVYEINMNSDPRTAGSNSLFMQAWRQLDGTVVGNVFKCPHSKYVAFSMPARR
ncbi:hypothetical protein NW762_011306 [Fusarium torreyae]|uniref:Uncharacterized protein n=1 Tax=Fusarium torreyae TaxID=1237075 RepID=A0A9W8RRM8_9HYPO|nr:hypothetical protein NW762_011306 [Fusarium torreyae]